MDKHERRGSTMKYRRFGRKEFEYKVREILIKNRLGFLSDITESYPNVWERVYAVSTANKSVDILIFSSIDIATDYVRDRGDDAVRLVLRWKTKNGYVYKRVAKHLRIRTLFANIQKSIENCQKEVFNLKYREFSKEIEFSKAI